MFSWKESLINSPSFFNLNTLEQEKNSEWRILAKIILLPKNIEKPSIDNLMIWASGTRDTFHHWLLSSTDILIREHILTLLGETAFLKNDQNILHFINESDLFSNPQRQENLKKIFKYSPQIEKSTIKQLLNYSIAHFDWPHSDDGIVDKNRSFLFLAIQLFKAGEKATTVATIIAEAFITDHSTFDKRPNQTEFLLSFCFMTDEARLIPTLGAAFSGVALSLESHVLRDCKSLLIALALFGFDKDIWSHPHTQTIWKTLTENIKNRHLQSFLRKGSELNVKFRKLLPNDSQGFFSQDLCNDKFKEALTLFLSFSETHTEDDMSKKTCASLIKSTPKLKDFLELRYEKSSNTAAGSTIALPEP